MIGVYVILNKKNGKLYIGSSSDVDLRLWQHKNKLRNNSHINKHLQNAFNMYGEKSFIFELIDTCTILDLLQFEQTYIDIFEPEYNISKNAESPMRGLKRDSLSVIKSINTKRKNGFFDNQSERMKNNVYAKGSKRTREEIEKLQSGRRLKVCRKVNQILNGKIIMVHSSLKEAANYIGVHINSIWKCCKNQMPSCRGFEWQYG